jgi:L-iditol 2-dehydrogenase
VDEIASNDSGISAGDRVTVTPLIPCGRCDYCRIGQSTLCDDYDYYGSRTDGAMAEYVRVKIDNIIKLPLNVDFEAGAMTDPVAVALHAVKKCNIEPGQRVAVFGLGAIGLLAIQWLKQTGCSAVFAVDIIDEKLDLAGRLGADLCINGRSQDTVEVINSTTGNKGVDAVIELAGSKITQVQAIEAVRKLGRVVYCGISYDDLLIPNPALNRILRGEITVLGAWNSLVSPLPINEWKSSLDFVDRGKIKCQPVISHRFRLEECVQAFDMMYNHKEVFNKVLFKPED